MIVPPVFPCRSVFLFVPVSRSPYSPGLHQAHPQLPVYIRFTIHFLISLFASVSRVLVSPGLHQPRPQFSVYIWFTIHFRFLFSPPFYVRLSVPVFLLPPFFPFAVLPGAFFPVPSFTFSTFLPSSVTSSMFRLINSSTSDSL